MPPVVQGVITVVGRVMLALIFLMSRWEQDPEV